MPAASLHRAAVDRLPFEDGEFGAVLLFAVLTCLPEDDLQRRTLAEVRRVLRPGGKFLCLEFSTVALPVLDRLYDLYSFQVLPALGKWVAKDEESYRYLAESIRRFPQQEVLCAKMRDAGLEQVSYRNLSGGIAAIHSAWRRGPTTAASVARSAAVLALLTMTWVASFAFLRWDPIDVVTWYMD